MKRIHCIRYGETVAIDMFIMMLNTKYQGSKFTWKDFPDIAKDFAIARLLMSYPDRKPTAKEYALCGESAKKWAQKAIKKAGLI